jgi:hypothetical protein
MDTRTNVDRRRRPLFTRILLCFALAVGVGTCFLFDASDARAESLACSWVLGGDINSASVEVRNCSVEEVLDCLSEKFDLHYYSTARLAVQVTGTYEGSLHRILPRLLQGYNFFLRYSTSRLELKILGEDQTSLRNKVENKRNQNEHDGSATEPEFGG